MKDSATKAVSVLLASLLFCGCASQSVFFSSNPSNATVTAGPVSGKTPCFLDVPDGCVKARFVSADGKTVEAYIPEPPGVFRIAATECRGAAGETCKLISLPFLAIGVIGLLIIRISAEGLSSDADSETVLTLLAVTAGSLVAGGLLYGGGDLLIPNAPPYREVHVNFPGAEPYNIKELRDHGHPKYRSDPAPPDRSYDMTHPLLQPEPRALPKL